MHRIRQNDPRQVYRVGLESVPFLLAVGDLLIGWLLLLHAEIALNALDGDVAHDVGPRRKRGTLPTSSPVAREWTSIISEVDGSTHLPPMYSLSHSVLM